ncbi:MAG: hypothetical protein J6C67_05550 [Muribaculaceae bacterium]|nr:hypothetical protein [Muribaculaceae bacterium]
MKTLTTAFFTTLAVLFSVTIVSSCSKALNIQGAWQASPSRLDIPGAADATATVTVDFGTADGSGTGDVNLSAVINIQQAVSADAPAVEMPWMQNIAATASVTGRYMSSEHDDDDIILSLNPSTLTVNVDPSGISYNEDMLSGMDSAAVDSLTAATADRWRVLITNAIRAEFDRYTTIEDVKIHHGEIMSAEICDRDVTLRNTASL